MDLTITIGPLTTLSAEMLAELNRGYTSSARYRASKSEGPERTTFTLEWEMLPAPYVKHWDSDEEELARYQEIATEGHSLAAYEADRQVALALCEPRRWNGTLWIWEFHVAESHRRHGIGRRLMDTVAVLARQDGFRALGLETQNTNTPAITFYRAVGFEIDAIDLSLYTNTDATDGEVAIFMKRKL
jgi:streptothricin acetyltransferase